MKKVLVNVEFKDAYTGEHYKPGQTIELSEERVAEVSAVNKNMISVIGNVEAAAEEPIEEPIEDPIGEPKEKTKKK